MNNEQIYKKIEEIYNSEKGKGFIIHLLRSFFPIHKSHFLWDSPKSGEIKCCITGEKLSSKQEITELVMSDEMRKAFIDNLKNSFLDNKYEYPKELKDKIHPHAINCEGSDKYLSESTFKQLLNFYQTRLLIGDKKIEWMSNNERAKEYVKEAKDDKIIQTKKEERAVHKVVEHTKMTFGDLKVLQDLKKKMEKEDERKRNSEKE